MDGGLALDATVRAAAPYQRARQADVSGDRAVVLRSADVRVKERVARVRNLVVFVVDASGSMGTYERMSAVKGAIRSLLADAYQQRDAVGLVGFRGDRSETLLSPTSSVTRAARELAALPTGGRTPLAAGLERAHQLIRRERRKASTLAPVLVLVSDGHTNYAGSDEAPVDAAMARARELRRDDVPAVCFDTETGPVRLGIVERLAERLDARYYRFDDLDAGGLSAAVQDVFDGDGFPGR